MLNSHATKHRWDELQTDHPIKGAARERVVGSEVMVSRVRLDTGCVVAMHAHANEQMACVLSGRIRFLLGPDGSRDCVLGAGEVLHIPANEPHGAEVIEACEILDIFAPPSETTGIDQT